MPTSSQNMTKPGAGAIQGRRPRPGARVAAARLLRPALEQLVDARGAVPQHPRRGDGGVVGSVRAQVDAARRRLRPARRPRAAPGPATRSRAGRPRSDRSSALPVKALPCPGNVVSKSSARSRSNVCIQSGTKPSPMYRRAFDQQVTGDDDALLGQEHDDVAAGVAASQVASRRISRPPRKSVRWSVSVTVGGATAIALVPSSCVSSTASWAWSLARSAASVVAAIRAAQLLDARRAGRR